MSIRPRSLLAPPVAALAALLTVAGALSPAAAATPPPTTTTPATAAAGWLAQQFAGPDHRPSPDGDHFEGSYASGGQTVYYFDGGRTADAIFGLAAAGVGRTRIQAAIGYFAQHVGEYASYGDGQTAKTALAAMVAGADPRSFGGQDLLHTLKADECTATSNADGSDYNEPACPAAGAGQNVFSSVSESFIILAEARAGGAAAAPSDAAVGYFLSLQCADGGFTVAASAEPACTADPDATGYAILALQALGGHAAELGRAAAWLSAQQAPGGYWQAQGGPDADTTGIAAAALAAAGRDVTAARTWLAAQQVTTGPTVGAGASRGAIRYPAGAAFDADTSVKATADALLGLAGGPSLATLTAAGAAAGAPVLALAAPAVSAPALPAGGRATVTGTGFAAGERVSAVGHSAPVALGTASADKAGTVTIAFTVPGTLAPGAHTLTLTGQSSGLSSSIGFTVLAAATSGPTSGPKSCADQALACTGRDGPFVRGAAFTGLGLLIAGLAVLWLGRRRRRA